MVPLVQRGRVPGGESRVMDDTNRCSSGQKAEDPIDPKHVQISVHGRVSSITFERRAELGTKEAEYFHEEFSSGGVRAESGEGSFGLTLDYTQGCRFRERSKWDADWGSCKKNWSERRCHSLL